MVFARPAPICIAVANSLSGPSAPAGSESLAAIELAVDEANRAGGVRGRPIELVPFDDESSGDAARRNVAAIAESRCLAVLGHYLSTASLAAGPLYRDARIPVLTGTSFVDELTTGNPWYFRAQTTASVQGRSIGDYLDVLMRSPSVELIHSDDGFGRSFRDGFASTYEGRRFRSWTFDPDSAERVASSRAIAEALARQPGRGIVVIGTGADNIPDVVTAIRRRGISENLVAAGGAGSVEFLQRFASEPEERRQPGFFSQNLYATPPVIFDSAGDEAQALAARYRAQTHRVPGWITASSYDAARIMIEALRRAKVRNSADTLHDDRARVRAALAGMDSPETGVRGLTRTLYFDAERNMPSPVRVGLFAFGRFLTAPRQLVLVERPETLDLAAEEHAGHIITVGGERYWLQQVVYTGIDLNRLGRIDIQDGTFTADVNLWMRFAGDGDAPTRIEFPDLQSRDAFDPQRPAKANPIFVPAGVNTPIGWEGRQYSYRLYRIIGDFKANFDLHQYPFDEQQLLIRFHNQDQRRELVTYVIDSFGLRLSNTRQALPTDAAPVSGIEQWRLQGLRYFVDSLSTSSSLGVISRVLSGEEVHYAGFNVAIVLKRNYGIFVIKTLLPLVLLLFVVFATLFLPANLFRERITIPVTAILTSAVLLLSVNNQLGDIGYIVAIEYVFYIFFALCLATMMVGIAHDTLVTSHRPRGARILARTSQILYIVIVVLVALFFWWRYGSD